MAPFHLFSGGAAQFVPRALVFGLLLWLTWFYLFLDFRGLSAAEGMDQAQIAREGARGNGFVTKVIKPLALHQINASKESEAEHVGLRNLQDTYHAPLNPLLNSIVLRLFKSEWEYEKDAPVYYLDRVIAIVSSLLFLASTGVSYLLIARIFDVRIAGVSAVLVLLCELLWNFAQSGLAQMLMLFLFTFALYFMFKAVENANADKSPVLWIALCGGFLGLLALSHWLTIWISIGALIFTALYFRPRGVTAFVLLGILMIVILPWGVRNWIISGSPLGSGFYGVYNGLGGGTESAVMRNFDPSQSPLPSEGLPTKVMVSSLLQLNTLYALLGSVAVSPLFFLSLLHPFRRPEIAGFRWAIFSMWIAAVLGMSIFGLTKGRLDPNQLHILFIPLMAAYGLAFLAVLWTRLGLGSRYPMLRNGHFIIVITLSALPLILMMPQSAITGWRFKGFPNWPPYVPAAITRISDWTDENEVVVADVPWAVAWYADRMSLWLPKNREQFDILQRYAADRGTPLAGVFLTPVTIDRNLATEIMQGEYSDWAWLIMRGELFRNEGDVMKKKEFPFLEPKLMPIAGQSIYYSDSEHWQRTAENK